MDKGSLKMKRNPIVRACYGDDGGPPFNQPLTGRRLNALLALDFHHATARRYLVRHGYAVAAFVVFDQSWSLTEQPLAAGVEIVRKTGSINKPRGVRA